MIEPEQAVRMAERLSCLQGFPRGANRAGTLAEIAIALREACTDDRQALAVTEMYQQHVRWQGIWHFRKHAARVTTPSPEVPPAHWRGYRFPEPPITDNEMLDRVDAAAAAAIDGLHPLERAELEQEANRLGAADPIARWKCMKVLWLDQHERQYSQNPEALPGRALAADDTLFARTETAEARRQLPFYEQSS